jgi:hypothetical protein
VGLTPIAVSHQLSFCLKLGCDNNAVISGHYVFNAARLLLHISSSWVKIRLYTKNQLPRLSGSGLKIYGGGLI